MSCTPVVENIRVHAVAIIAHPQQKLALVVDDFCFDLMCLCVLERIAQGLDGNPVNFAAGMFRALVMNSKERLQESAFRSKSASLTFDPRSRKSYSHTHHSSLTQKSLYETPMIPCQTR
jgi:hypothetical protein